jgi:hypothetical protein
MLPLQDAISILGLSNKIERLLVFNGIRTIRQLITNAQNASSLIELAGPTSLEWLSIQDLQEIDECLIAHGLQSMLPERTYLSVLNLSKRTENLLTRNDILTVEQLQAITSTQLCQLRGLGQRGLDEIYAKLAESRMRVVNQASQTRTISHQNTPTNAQAENDVFTKQWGELCEVIRSQIRMGSLHPKAYIQGDTVEYWLNITPQIMTVNYLQVVYDSFVAGLRKTSVTQELVEAFSGLSDKEINVFLFRLGPTRLTLEALGQKWGITRERARQIAVKAGKKIDSRFANKSCLRIQTALLIAEDLGERIIYRKWLRQLRNLNLLEDWQTKEISRCFEGLDPSTVLFAVCNPDEPRTYHCRYSLSSNLRSVFGKKNVSAYLIKKIDELSNAQRKHISRQARIGAAVSAQSLMRQVDLSAEEVHQVLKVLGFHQVGEGWYTLAPKDMGDTARRKWAALHTVMKMLQYCGNLEIKEIHSGLRRYASRFKFEVPPPSVLIHVLKLYGFDLEDGRVYWRFPNNIDASPGEQIALDRLRELGNVAGYFEFAETFEKQGRSFPLLSMTLSKSPLICKVESGLYKLRGCDLSYEDIQRARERQLTINADSDVSFNVDGSIVLSINLGHMAIFTGVVSCSHLANLDGRWNVQYAQSRVSQVRVKNGQMWTLTNAFRAANAHVGDRVELVFNTWSRVVTIKKLNGHQ